MPLNAVVKKATAIFEQRASNLRERHRFLSSKPEAPAKDPTQSVASGPSLALQA
jgi:hypothetical protein